jgi:hypothetical protein
MPELLEEFTDMPLVAISESQKRWAPDANWVGVVHNGLPRQSPLNSATGSAEIAKVGASWSSGRP